MNIALIGFMCSGKSRIGKMLAQRLSWEFIDTDDLVVQSTGMSIADLLTSKGETYFRTVEKTAVQKVSALDYKVIATGGGVPLDPENIQSLAKNSNLVWLKVSPETVLKRAGNFASRPLIDPSNPLDSIRKRMTQREPFYAVAPYSIQTDTGNSKEVVDKIISFFPTQTS